MDARQQRLCWLQEIAGHRSGRPGRGRVGIGHAGVDAALGGGIGRGQLHELFAADAADAAAALGAGAIFARGLGGPVLWLREAAVTRRMPLHAPGLAGLGMDPGALLLGALPDAGALLCAAVDALRCSGLGAAVIELWRQPRLLDLTASRRLQLAAEASGVTALMLRIAATPQPSAAATRWAVASIPGRPLEAGAPGFPALALELLRQRGGGQGRWLLEWDRDAGVFRDLDGEAVAGAVVSAPANRPAADGVAMRRAG